MVFNWGGFAELSAEVIELDRLNLDLMKSVNKMAIIYKFPEEIEFAKHYAEKLNDEITLSILDAGEVKNSAEAKHLSLFFWNMVNKSVEDKNNKILLPWPEGGEFWSDKLLYSISGCLERAGFENEWEEISDLQD